MGAVSIELTSDLNDKIVKAVIANPSWLLCIPEVRMMIANDRLIKAGEVEAMTDDSGNIHEHTIVHNVNGLANNVALWRPDLLYYPLVSIEYIRLNVKSLELLSIGPRSEAEVFTALACGFELNNIKAIDLLTYGELIEQGDMHALPYEDSSFDIVVAGWVLAYSANNQLVAKEILRVLRPGGYVAIGCVAEPELTMPIGVRGHNVVGGKMCVSDDPERPGEEKTVSRFWNMRQIHDLFMGHIDTVVFNEQPHPALRDYRTNLMTIFRTKGESS